MGHRVTHVSVNDQEVAIQSTNGHDRRTFRAKAAIIASGFGSNLPKRLGFGTIGDFTIGVQAEVATQGVNEVEVYLGEKVAPGFFGWLVPTSQDRALWGLLSRHNAAAHLETLLSRLRARSKVQELVKENKRWGIPLRPLARTYGTRVIVVEDAAGQTKPTTGGGIYYSLLSADIAVESLHKAFLLNDLSSSQLSDYEKRWKALLAKELRIGYYARRLYEMLGDQQIEYLLKTVAVNGIHEELINTPELSFDWHGELILKAMRFKTLNRVVRSIRPIAAAFRSKVNGS